MASWRPLNGGWDALTLDNCCLWDIDFADHIWHIVEFLIVTGQNGIIQNQTKFVFWQEELEFIVFDLKKDGFAPCSVTIKAIQGLIYIEKTFF